MFVIMFQIAHTCTTAIIDRKQLNKRNEKKWMGKNGAKSTGKNGYISSTKNGGDTP